MFTTIRAVATIRTVIVAAPLAAAALTLAPSAAMADQPAPIIVIAPQPDEPKGPGDLAPAPKPQGPKGPQDLAPAPKPQGPKGPGDIAPAPKPQQPKGPGDIAPAPKPQGPKGPGDIAPAPKPQGPKGPGDLTAPAPCPTHGVDCSPSDEPADPESGGGASSVDTTVPSADEVESIAVPTRIDAGLASDETGGMDLTWLLVGGGIVTASGVAVAARHRRRSSLV